MEQEKNNKGIIALLVVIIVILLALVVLLATGTISFKSEKDNNENQLNENTDINDINALLDSVTITNLTFDKPVAGGIGGEPYTLATNMTVDLSCTNSSVAGIQVAGYCLDKDNNKYLFNGPVSVAAFYCNNNENHSDSGFVQAYQLFKSDGTNYVIPEKTRDIKWEDIEIKYCKFDEAYLVLSDYSKLNTKMNLNYEKEFK